MTQQPSPARGRMPALDGLRGLAVLLVLGHHMFPKLLPGGFLGVDLFFVLSGFLITTLLLDEHARTGRISLRHFYVRRALRLLPAMWVFLLAVGVVGLVAADGEMQERVAVFVSSTLLFVANLVVAGDVPTYASHTWSLSAEEQFYFVWPLVLIGGLALAARGWLGPRGLLRFASYALLFVVALRTVRWMDGDGGQQWTAFYYGPLHADGLLAGCVIALARAQSLLRFTPRQGTLLAVTGCLLLLAAATTVEKSDPLLYAGAYVPLVLAAAAVVAGCSVAGVRWLVWRPLQEMGRISYAVYLWSGVVLDQFAFTLPGQLLGAACVIALSVASYHFVEVPAMRLKGRFGRAPAPAPAAAG